MQEEGLRGNVVEKLPLHMERLRMELVRFVRMPELPYIIKPLPLISLSNAAPPSPILNFDVGFASGEDATALEEKARTQFTTSPGDFVFEVRETADVIDEGGGLCGFSR